MRSHSRQHWHYMVDRGGTFTDVVARDPGGALHVIKLLSDDPQNYADAATEAMRRLTGVRDGPLPPADLRLGTTVATNALLERKGEPTLLAITRGFGDALIIGTQERPELFVREIKLPPPLFAEVVEVDERMAADGAVLRPLDHAAARAALSAAFDRGLRAIAIVLMHGYRFTAHEAALAAIARDIGFTQISVSHQIAPLIKLIGRGDTTVVDAYLSPVLRRYVDTLAAHMGPDVAALFMQSNGGLTPGDAFHGKDAILSGPAGGIVGMAETARQAGFDAVIGFDMGGTSTDVSHYAGTFERDSETRVAGARIRAPMMRIHTVAAGGGSICRYEHGRLIVGPQSAGAVPGPACYRRGGPLTITDCNLLLGKIQPGHFPAIFGPQGNQPLDGETVRAAFAALADAVAGATGTPTTADALAEGFIAIAVANMANAIKTISVARGHDLAGYALACFGGAGGQHACLVADALAMDRVLIHPLAGVLSAYGMGLADRRLLLERTLALPFDEQSRRAFNAAIADLVEDAVVALAAQGIARNTITATATVALRQTGSDHAIAVPLADPASMRADFAAAWRAQFGFDPDGALIAETMSVEAVAAGERPDSLVEPLPHQSAPAEEMVTAYLAGAARHVPLYRRDGLAAGFTTNGPAIIVDAVSTTVVEPDWSVAVDAIGNLILTRRTPRVVAVADGTAIDPVRLEIFNGLFMAIAEEMGAALQRTAASVNIRERLDFSCALFDATGALVANAPHMPVHLGSMGESVRAIMAARGAAVRDGEVFALNAPFAGGTHLPDITVVMPVVVDGDTAPAFWVAARGHHADLGGIAPGSMPPDSTHIDEEGILFDNVRIVAGGQFDDAGVRALLAGGAWPARNPDQNIGDLKAQVAACAKGASELRRVAAVYGVATIQQAMAAVQANAEAMVRALLDRLDEGSFRYAMDNGAAVAVSVTIDRAARCATVDFTGTSAQLPGNFNAPLSVVRAAVLYVIRTLIDDAIPMNEGCLRPINIIVPDGSMLCPVWPAAVVAGNVETSQVVTDALFGALGAMAGAQGTMNNLTFGNERHQYYETIAGGAGAGPGFHGASAVQTHMTNSRLTDPEILETRFPVRLDRFAIRRGSGGSGQWHGGDGVVRAIRFLEPMQAGILSNRRRIAPFGLAGGSDGATGINRVERAVGSVEKLDATAAVGMAAGDVLVIETPGGGGYGGK